MEPLRICRTCGLEAWTRDDLELFTKQKDNPYGRATQCKTCKNERLKETASIRRYGITRKEYEARMAMSDKCECCGKTAEDLEGHNSLLCYDHDHTTMEFRGVLCTNCNLGIGYLGDTKEGVEKALSYFLKQEG